MHVYDETRESAYIQYLEDISIIANDFIIKYNKNSACSYTLMVDLDYPEYLQALHGDLPISPEKILINKEENIMHFSQQKKLQRSH